MRSRRPLPPFARPSGRPFAGRRAPAALGLGAVIATGTLALGPTEVGAVAGAAVGAAPCRTPGEFPDETLDAWQTREFAGSTEYALVDEDGRRTLEASTDGAASILYREREVDVGATPVLAWSWKVDGVFADIDERTRDGDDYPARVYVVVKTGFLPWQTLALNYVWSSNQPEGSSWPSPFTDKARMIAVRSGGAEAGAWACERRDVAADFEAAFGTRIDRIDGYAIMVDGDNGARRARARFGALGFGPG